MQSPGAARGGSRRQTGESYPFPNSVTSPNGREEQRAPSPPASLLRRRTDIKDSGKSEDAGEEKVATTPSGTVKRNPIGPLGGAGFGVPTSPWANGPQSAGFSPMGSFGNFGLGGSGQATPGDKRAGLGSGRAESRFKNLLQKDSNEDLSGKTLEHKTSVSNLSKVNENESWRSVGSGATAALMEEPEEDDGISGSAALAAGSDLSPPNAHQGLRGFDTPSRSNTRDRDFGFGAFGMTSDNAGGFGSGFLQSNQQTPGRPAVSAANDPQSPTDTNPYKSPEHHGADQMRESLDDTPDIPNAPLPGLGFGGDSMHQGGGLGGLGALPNLGRHVGNQGPASDDRSQTSSVGPNRGFTGLGGLGQFGGPSAWPTSQPGLGTPGRQAAGLSNAFGGGMLGNSLGDMQSPSLAGLGGGSAMSPHVGSAFGGSRMSSMFPQGMQDQMRQGDQHEDRSGQAQFGGLGGHDNDNPFQGQGFSGQLDNDQKTLEYLQDQMASQGHHQQPGSSASNQPPAPQQRTMVMPDRMRWIYRDPQGQTQGPWSGLEMHDWYKAGFFSPELLVKKAEDADYEPLAQLIRRIGNSREPFLVPQIGIPHGQNTAPPAGAWAATAPPAAAAPAGGAQPPFASSFPSFGTTLTADQQNALERRKQEEQYLMARQKEHLAQAQIAHRMQHIPGPHSGFAPGGPSQAGQLHRHSSAQSLHSQPSFGSITSPGNFQASPTQAPATGVPTGFFDNSFRNQQAGLGAVGAGIDSLGQITEEEIPSIMNRLNLGNRSGQPNQFGAPGQPFSQQQQAQDAHAQQVQQMLQDRARLNEEQAKHDAAEQDQTGQQVPNERLQEFQKLQEQENNARTQAAAKQEVIEQPAQAESTTTESNIGSPVAAQAEQSQTKEPLTLTEQVQKAASAKQSPVPTQSPWAKVDTGIPQPFPPAPSQSPLPAPAAQRTSRQTVADHLNAESRSRSQTPSVETPTTVAPWAKEPAGPPKGPSLKEIQEAEAKKAAQQEELAAAARRAALQKELELQTAAAAAASLPAPGLPSSSTWAAPSASPVPSGASAWAKPAQPKPTSTAAKSMAQIQKEEEARKRRVAAAAAQAQAVAMASVPSPAGGKSYANLAGKVMPAAAQAPPAPGSSAWTTVGASGKTKLPAAPSPAPAARTPSATILPTVQPSLAAAVKKAPSRSATLIGSGAVNAQEEFRKWAINELRPDLNPGISGKSSLPLHSIQPQDPSKLTKTPSQPKPSSPTSTSSPPTSSSSPKPCTAAAPPSTRATSPTSSSAASASPTKASSTLPPRPRAVVPLMRRPVAGARSRKRAPRNLRRPRRTRRMATLGLSRRRRRGVRSRVSRV